MSEAGVTARLAAFIEDTGFASIPAVIVDKAKELITDFLGVTVAGAREQSARIVQEMIREHGAPGEATILGTPLSSKAPWAALANGVAGHALDFDDTSQPMYGHPTAPVLPAALSLGETLNVSGQTLLEAYIMGVEVTVKLSYGMNPSHYEHGWHSTCTLGSIGSAVAAAKILGLRGARLRNALAVAASQAGGLQQNFGTMTKPFHAGRAAENGILAAILAEKGWTGDQNILDSPLGFFHVFCGEGGYEGERVVGRLGKPFDIGQPGIILKKYPSCAFSHPAVDAALAIAADPEYESSRVERVEGIIHALADQILIHRHPRTGLEAKFSLEGCIAMALLDTHLNASSFSDQRVARNDMVEFMPKIERKVMDSGGVIAKDFGPATVKVFLKSGRVLQKTVQKAKGNPENPMSPQDLEEKYADCCTGSLSRDTIERSLSLLRQLDRLKAIRDLTGCFRCS